jgi:D-psicose/D-tagatose/L-ribulose 3-epimerase
MPASKKLTVSNIAWDSTPITEILPILRNAGVSAIEVAPTVVWPNWQGATVEAAEQYADGLREEGFSIPSLQAILFAKPDLHLFGSPQQIGGLKSHIEYVADLAQAMGAKILVFGAPKNRLRGATPFDRARHIAVEFFSHVGDACAKRGVCLCIEPNPVQYGCDFITNSADGFELVELVNSKGFGLHLDVAGMHLADESAHDAIVSTADRLRHIHISEPNLQDFTQPVCDHASAAKALQEIDYTAWVSIEMRKSEQPKESLKRACDFVMERYFDVQPSRL